VKSHEDPRIKVTIYMGRQGKALLKERKCEAMNKLTKQACDQIKSGDRAALLKTVKEINAKTDRKRAAFKSGSLGLGGKR
jgi:hypothetical protein